MVVEFCHNLLLILFVWLLSKKGQPKFRKWVLLEEQKNKILKAVGNHDKEFPEYLFAYLSTALCISPRYIQQASWTQLISAFYKTVLLTACQFSLPILEPSKEKIEEDAWNYEGRTWYQYAHLLSHSFGWNFEYISNLSVQDALSAVQEILVNDQLEKEFLWDTSERSTYWDDKTKTSKRNPLPRPQWMNKKIDPQKELRVTQIPVNMLPTGKGISQDELIAQTS